MVTECEIHGSWYWNESVPAGNGYCRKCVLEEKNQREQNLAYEFEINNGAGCYDFDLDFAD